MSLKILHVPFGYFPSVSGGTEVYVKGLCEALRSQGFENVIAAPGGQADCYDFEGFEVHRFTGSSKLPLEALYGKGDALAADHFDALLGSIKPDIVHFHSYTPAVSVLCLTRAKARGLPCIFTYHTPTTSCLRGSMMRWGSTPCDGVLRNHTCSTCFLHGHGVPKMAAHAVALGSILTGRFAQNLPNRWRIALSTSSLVRRNHNGVHFWLQGMDRIVALCSWTKDLLALNGIKDSRVRMVRHGINYSAMVEPDLLPPLPLRLVFFGRLDATKGVQLLVEALAMMPDAPVQLDLYTLSQGNATPMMQAVMDRANQDERIHFLAPLPPEDVVLNLGKYHALVVPSLWQETGPLVVLEAFAAGIPVIGSSYGGIAERVRHNENGLLVSSNPSAWRDALSRLIDEPELLHRLKKGIQAPRTMQDVATEMNDIYRELTPPS